MARRRRRFRPDATGFRVDLHPVERAVLGQLPGQLIELLATDDPSLVRLFPPAYLLDAEHDAEYRRLMREDLLDGRLEAARTLASTAQRDHLTDAEVVGWMRAINDLRLVLGTQLDIQEDMDEADLPIDGPDAARFQAYVVLTGILGEIVDALG